MRRTGPGEASADRVPTRTCIGCRAKVAKAELTRVVFDGQVVRVDADQRLPGRGAYLHPGCLSRALRTRAVPRALRVPPGVLLSVADDLAELERQAARLGDFSVTP